MTRGKLLPDKKLRREMRQMVSFKDPISKKAVEVRFSTIHEGEHNGCPVVEINGRFVIWEIAELVHEAVMILREAGVLPTSTEKEDAKKEPDDKEKFKGFSPAAPKGDD